MNLDTDPAWASLHLNQPHSPHPLSVSPGGDGGGWGSPNVVMPLAGIRRLGHRLDLAQKSLTQLNTGEHLIFFLALLPSERGLLLVKSEPVHP